MSDPPSPRSTPSAAASAQQTGRLYRRKASLRQPSTRSSSAASLGRLLAMRACHQARQSPAQPPGWHRAHSWQRAHSCKTSRVRMYCQVPSGALAVCTQPRRCTAIDECTARRHEMRLSLAVAASVDRTNAFTVCACTARGSPETATSLGRSRSRRCRRSAGRSRRSKSPRLSGRSQRRRSRRTFLS
jgi:hypothetical protein